MAENTLINLFNRASFGQFPGDPNPFTGRPTGLGPAQPSGGLAEWFHGLGQRGYHNPSPFRRGIDSDTAYETRKKAKRIYAPAMAGIIAQDALLDPTLQLLGRQAQGYGDIWRGQADQAQDYWMNAIGRVSPGSQDLIAQLTRDASSMVGGVNPYEDDLLRQTLRQAQAARGTGYGSSDVMLEALGLDRSREGRRIARGQYGADIARLGQDWSSQILGLGVPWADLRAQGVGLNTGDITSIGLNDTMQRRNQQAARRAGNMQLAGSAIGGLFGLVGGAMGA